MKYWTVYLREQTVYSVQYGLDLYCPQKLSMLYLPMHMLTLSKTTNFRLFQSERICRQQFQI